MGDRTMIARSAVGKIKSDPSTTRNSDRGGGGVGGTPLLTFVRSEVRLCLIQTMTGLTRLPRSCKPAPAPHGRHRRQQTDDRNVTKECLGVSDLELLVDPVLGLAGADLSSTGEMDRDNTKVGATDVQGQIRAHL